MCARNKYNDVAYEHFAFFNHSSIQSFIDVHICINILTYSIYNPSYESLINNKTLRFKIFVHHVFDLFEAATLSGTGNNLVNIDGIQRFHRFNFLITGVFT